MHIKPIRTKKDHQAALKTIEGLMTAKRNTPDGDRLDVLVTLVQAYEAKHFPLDAPNPVAAIRLVMEQRNLAPKDLSAIHWKAEPRLRGARRTPSADDGDGVAAAYQAGNSCGVAASAA